MQKSCFKIEYIPQPYSVKCLQSYTQKGYRGGERRGREEGERLRDPEHMKKRDKKNGTLDIMFHR